MSQIVRAARELERESKNEILKRLEFFFNEADKDADGFLTMNELTRTLRRYGYRGSHDEIKRFFNLADTSGDDKVSRDEYMSVMKKAPTLTHSEAAMRRVFSMFDKDGSGSIDRDELKDVFAELGNHFPDTELTRMMSLVDADKSGELEYEEFIRIVLGRKASVLRSSSSVSSLDTVTFGSSVQQCILGEASDGSTKPVSKTDLDVDYEKAQRAQPRRIHRPKSVHEIMVKPAPSEHESKPSLIGTMFGRFRKLLVRQATNPNLESSTETSGSSGAPTGEGVAIQSVSSEQSLQSLPSLTSSVRLPSTPSLTSVPSYKSVRSRNLSNSGTAVTRISITTLSSTSSSQALPLPPETPADSPATFPSLTRRSVGTSSGAPQRSYRKTTKPHFYLAQSAGVGHRQTPSSGFITQRSGAPPLRHSPPSPAGESTRKRSDPGGQTKLNKHRDKMSHAEIKTAAKTLEKASKQDILKRMEGFFKEADKDKDGYLTLQELTGTLRRYGYRGSEDEIRKFFHYADTSKDHLVSLDEYMTVMQTSPSLTHTEARMRRVFTMFDKDGNGSIDRLELKQVFEEMGKFFGENELQQMIDAADADQSGALEYEEFIALCTSRHNLT